MTCVTSEKVLAETYQYLPILGFREKQLQKAGGTEQQQKKRSKSKTKTMKEEENNIKNKIFKDGQQKALFHVGLTSGWVWSEWHEGFDCACPAGQQLGGRYSAAFSPPACPAGSKAVLRLM